MVDFSGYVVATEVVTMNETKVETIKAWKPPTSVREALIFMSFANFYRRFIKIFSDIFTQITKINKKGQDKICLGKRPARSLRIP